LELGFKSEAIELVKKALEFAPDNARLVNNLKSMQ
jgi:hypothetical protein